MKYLARKSIESAIRRLQLALNPKAKKTPQKSDDAQVTLLFQQAKNDIDTASTEINGQTTSESSEVHSKVNEMSEKLLNHYYISGDIESIHALASGLIAQLTETQAKEHLEAFQEHYIDYVKGE